MILVSLKQKLDAISVVLDSIPYGTDAWMQIQNHIERFKKVNYLLHNGSDNLLWRNEICRLIEDEKNDRCAT
jgi:hypothetical protein